MKVIVGLGNPSMEYVGTRHNVGFETIDRLANELGISMDNHKHKAISGQGRLGGEKILLVKPQTYMNLSGESVGAIMSYYKVGCEDLIVISDDIDLPIGKLRIRMRGSAGGHNGLKNIMLHLHTEDFARIRIGVGGKRPGQDLASHVLSRFPKEELEIMAEAMDNACKAIELMVQGEAEKAMNLYNSKKK